MSVLNDIEDLTNELDKSIELQRTVILQRVRKTFHIVPIMEKLGCSTDTFKRCKEENFFVCFMNWVERNGKFGELIEYLDYYIEQDAECEEYWDQFEKGFF